MIFKAILATDTRGAIGLKSGELPWYIPEDFQWFKKTTSGYRVVMGGATARSLKKPLPDRINYVITKHSTDFGGEWVDGFKAGTVMFFSSITEFLRFSMRKEQFEAVCFVIGGETIYRQLMPYCNELYHTLIDAKFNAEVGVDFDRLRYMTFDEPVTTTLYSCEFVGNVVEYHKPIPQRPFDVTMAVLERRK